jgi:DNA-binding protein H-NS
MNLASPPGQMMKQLNFEVFLIDELWAIHEQVGNLLTEKMTAERNKIEDRLKQLRGDSIERRHHSRIPPKYRNPANPYQTWSGRGRTPLWIKRLQKEGKTIEDLRIPETA